MNAQGRSPLMLGALMAVAGELMAAAPWAAGTATEGETVTMAPFVVKADIGFLEPEKFKDVSDNGDDDGTAFLAAMEKFLGRESDRVLPEGYKLLVLISDIDRAGVMMPEESMPSGQLRYIGWNTTPSMTLRYRVYRPDGSIFAQGGEHLSVDTGFFMGTSLMDSDPLKYDKALLAQWLQKIRKRIAAEQAAEKAPAAGRKK